MGLETENHIFAQRHNESKPTATKPVEAQSAGSQPAEAKPVGLPVDLPFASRHIGPDGVEQQKMLNSLGLASLDELVDKAVPSGLRFRGQLNLPNALTEAELAHRAHNFIDQNRPAVCCMGQGFYGNLMPAVIQRQVLENPAWYTAYTPYQAEISQGRLEALLNFQQLVIDLTGMQVANSSLLDEGTAVAEAVQMLLRGQRPPATSRVEKKGGSRLRARDLNQKTATTDSGGGQGPPTTSRSGVFVDEGVFVSSCRVLSTRMQAMGVPLQVGDAASLPVEELKNIQVMVLQYPRRTGELRDDRDLLQRLREAGVLVVVATDLLALTLLTPPGKWTAEWGQDEKHSYKETTSENLGEKQSRKEATNESVSEKALPQEPTIEGEPAQPLVHAVVGSSQRLGVPMGYGGPSAAFLATLEVYKRNLPGRVVGVSQDVHQNKALRLALQTREQHIRRERATSNICTAQVLPAVLAAMYAVYHGPEGLKQIAHRVHEKACTLASLLQGAGFQLLHDQFFDTLAVRVPQAGEFVKKLDPKGVLVSCLDKHTLGVSVDESLHKSDLQFIFEQMQAVGIELGVELGVTPQAHTRQTHLAAVDPSLELLTESNTKVDQNTNTKSSANKQDVGCDSTKTHNVTATCLPPALQRKSAFCTHKVFNQHHSETKMLRYMARLEEKDLSLTHSMIPLGSCTMKLNAASELKLLSEPKLNLHPHTPASRTHGYQHIIKQLQGALCELTGFKACSLQPNAGSQGEFLGLLLIKKYHAQQGHKKRNVCLIPQSAHGTNPASARMAGLQVVQVQSTAQGGIDVQDLKAKAQDLKDRLACLMLTYPSTYGVFEDSVREVIECVHQYGGQVYLDGANLNAMVALCRPGDWGVDVAHVNLHKTFCIPHGGGGPGVGPVLVAEHLKPYLPSTRVECYTKMLSSADTIVTSSPFGSASILPISWAYVAMMGARGLKWATQVALLSANYIAQRLAAHYSILYRGQNNFVAHECIIDTRRFRREAGITVDDIAKRLMDYGFHAPTMSWPVAGGLMIEPTESEDLDEIDRFCEAMIQIRHEIDEIAQGQADFDDNVLKNAPHSYAHLMQDKWPHPYSREKAAFPLPYLRDKKFHLPVGRVDNAGGDRNFCCTL